MERHELEESIAALAGALGAIAERLERDFAEREKLIQASNAAVVRIAELEKQLADLVEIVASMRNLQ